VRVDGERCKLFARAAREARTLTLPSPALRRCVGEDAGVVVAAKHRKPTRDTEFRCVSAADAQLTLRKACVSWHSDSQDINMLFQFANVLVFFVLAVLFVGGMLALGRLVRPDNPEHVKLSTYECGEPPTGNAWVNFNIRFYMVALIFVVFDVEIAFIYPVAVVYREWVMKGQGLLVFMEILVFLGILFVGLVYVWVKGDLEWLKRVPAADRSEDSMRKAA